MDHQRQSNSEEDQTGFLRRKRKSCNGRQQERRDKKTLLCIYANGDQ